MGLFDNLFGSSDQKVKEKIDPRMRDFAYDTLDATDLATSQPYQAYPGPRIAGFGADTQAGMAGVRANAGRWVPFVDEAAGMARQGAAGLGMGDFTPERVTADQVQAGQLAGMNLDPYMNPWQSKVADAVMARMGQTHAAQQAELRRRTAGSSYGGTAGAVQSAAMTRDANEQMTRTMSELMMQGYTQAQAAAMADLQRKQQADLANQGANLQAGQFNSQMGLSAYDQNMRRQLAERGLSTQGAQILAQLGQQGQQMGYEDAARQLAIGEMEQAQRQRNLDQGYADFLEQRDHPFDMINFRTATAAGTPYSRTTVQQGGGASPIAQLAGVGLAGAGIWNRWFPSGG
jgi:hypothetical protein